MENLKQKDILGKLGKSSILATDIASQFWCEKQMELNYIYGKRYTKAMAKGTKIHEELQAQTYVPLAIEPINYTDYLYKEGYENYLSLKSLKSKGVGREIKVYGSINGYRLVGKIDELKMVRGKVVVVENKTREMKYQISEAIMRPHKIQVMLYKKILDDIMSKNYTIDNFMNTYGKGLKPMSEHFFQQLEAFNIEKSLASIEGIYKKMFEEIYTMPPISESLEVQYIDRYTGEKAAAVSFKYEKEKFEDLIINAMKYWNGEVEARPVSESEKWKCKFCKFFGNECKVWYS
ncbi:MAG: PD-(D/E)XK nuclease family protein [Candidatus Micrarchaeia archaeon]